MGMVAVAEGLAIGSAPREVIARGVADLAKFPFTAAVHVAKLTALEGPFKYRNIGRAGPDPEDHEEIALHQRELGKRGADVDVVKPLEVGDKLFVLEQIETILFET